MQADTAMPTQSAPQVSQTQPISYAAPVTQQTAAQAPAVATTPQWVAPYQAAVAPAPQMQAQMGVSQPQYSPTASYPQAYQAAPQAYQAAPQAPQAENPYKEAFNKVVGLLSSPVQFPFQGQQSTATQQTVPANYSSPVAPAQYNNQGMLTSTPGINNNQVYSSNSSQTSQEITAQQLLANGVSPASLEVIDHFGPDSPAILNKYACNIEDALITTNNQLIQAVQLLQEMSAEHKAYETILTDPDVLADYTCEFFGPNGPYPVPDEAPAYGRPVGQQMIRQEAPSAAPQRPQMPVPPQPQAQGNPVDFWNNFGSLADRDPANAWRYLNQAQANPEVFRQKLLVME
jgi:hypothetical protein